VVLRSPDDGRSWQIFGEIGNRVHNETDIAHLGKGRWLAAARALGPSNAPKAHTTEILVSKDDAKTWRTAGLSTAGNELPGDLCVLRDGRVVFTYGSRREGRFGTVARISGNGGRTWSEPLELASYTNRDSGYPSTVQNKDGHLVTAYYARSSREHYRYHMGVVIWESGG
jgi:predicted neuraminidase